MIKSKKQKKKKKSKKLTEPKGPVEHHQTDQIYIVGVPEGEGRKGVKRLFEE